MAPPLPTPTRPSAPGRRSNRPISGRSNARTRVERVSSLIDWTKDEGRMLALPSFVLRLYDARPTLPYRHWQEDLALRICRLSDIRRCIVVRIAGLAGFDRAAACAGKRDCAAG